MLRSVQLIIRRSLVRLYGCTCIHLATCKYQVEALFINFSVSTAKKGYRQGPGSGNLGESLVICTDFTPTVPVPKSYENHMKKTDFLCVYPLLVLRPDLDSSQDFMKFSQGIFQKNQKLTKL